MRATMFLPALLLPIALSLAGCGSDKEGTTISFNMSDSDGNESSVANVDGKTGEVSINAPGFKGKLSLPKLNLGGSDFSLNGVNLYPGSTIKTMNISAQKDDTDPSGDGEKGSVRVVFDSPATPDKVIDYFADKLGKADFTLTRKDTGLTGTDDEKKPFSLVVTPAADGHSTGVITAGG